MRRTELTVPYCMHYFQHISKDEISVHDIHFLLFLLDVDECTCTASSPLCDVNAQCSNIRGSYSCRCKLDSYFWKRKNLQRFVECRETRFKRCFKSKRCYFALRIQFALLLRSNSTGNLIQRPKISNNMQKRCYNTEHTSNPCKFRSRKHV